MYIMYLKINEKWSYEIHSGTELKGPWVGDIID